MAGVLLFCLAKEAKSFVPTVLNTDGGTGEFPYFLVKSRRPPRQLDPPDDTGFTERLHEGATFDTDFIGSSVGECAAWVLEHQDRLKYVDGDVFATLDERSPNDQTITFWFYARDIEGSVACLLGEGQEPNTWYSWRIPYRCAPELGADLSVGDSDEIWGVLFHRKDELTNKETGIFDYKKCKELVLQGQGFVKVPDVF